MAPKSPITSRAALRAVRSVAIALAALVTTSAIALATIPANGVIDACYSRSGGALRVIDRTVTNCSKNETSLAWNVQGVPGEKGEKGDPGEQGPAGPAGTSKGYDIGMATQTEITGPTTILSKSLPAGNYILSARVYVRNNDIANNAGGSCSIPGDSVSFVIANNYAGDGLALTSGIVHAGGAVVLQCDRSQFAEIYVISASMTAIKVDTLN